MLTHKKVPKIRHLSIKCYKVCKSWWRISWEMPSVKHIFNMTSILLNNFLDVWTMFVMTRQHIFGNLPAQLDSHGYQVHVITWFLQKQLLFHETLQEKVTWIWSGLRGGQKCPQLWCSGYQYEITQWQKIQYHISSVWCTLYTYSQDFLQTVIKCQQISINSLVLINISHATL
jgi:hypothetical protein